jgi:hypothetical protein
MIRIKRVYDLGAKADGIRLFVERLWPMAYILAANYLIFISRCYYGKAIAKRDTRSFY